VDRANLKDAKIKFASERDPVTNAPIEMAFTFKDFEKVDANFGLSKIYGK
jgi:hypothetical protein